MKEIYTATRALPVEERFGLSLQMRKAAVSVPSNIAEGYGLGTTPSFLKHLRISRGSLAELDTQLVLCGDLGFVESNAQPTDLLEETDRVLQGLIRSLEDKLEQEGPDKS